MTHVLELDLAVIGWNIAVCDCGWQSPGCPDPTTAAEVWGGHLVDQVAGRLRDLDGWSYCVVHDECIDHADHYTDDDGNSACPEWSRPDDATEQCRLVPLHIMEVTP